MPFDTSAIESDGNVLCAPCVAGVLIGGASRRMGACKAAMTFRGRSLGEHVADVAAQVASEVVLLGNSKTTVEGLHRFTQLPDSPIGHGPLRGLHSLLSYAGTRWVLLLACDMPLLTIDVLGSLLQARNERTDAVAFRRIDCESEYHACCAAYHPRALSAVRSELTTGVGKIQHVLRTIRCTALTPTAGEEMLLVNVNTPEVLASLAMRYSGTEFDGLQEVSG